MGSLDTISRAPNFRGLFVCDVYTAETHAGSHLCPNHYANTGFLEAISRPTNFQNLQISQRKDSRSAQTNTSLEACLRRLPELARHQGLRVEALLLVRGCGKKTPKDDEHVHGCRKKTLKDDEQVGLASNRRRNKEEN
jgi:hypothetical protein